MCSCLVVVETFLITGSKSMNVKLETEIILDLSVHWWGLFHQYKVKRNEILLLSHGWLAVVLVLTLSGTGIH